MVSKSSVGIVSAGRRAGCHMPPAAGTRASTGGGASAGLPEEAGVCPHVPAGVCCRFICRSHMGSSPVARQRWPLHLRPLTKGPALTRDTTACCAMPRRCLPPDPVLAVSGRAGSQGRAWGGCGCSSAGARALRGRREVLGTAAGTCQHSLPHAMCSAVCGKHSLVVLRPGQARTPSVRPEALGESPRS